jgi:hypothetical protein
MTERIEAKPKKIDKSGALRLWIGMLLPPIAWGVQLQSLYLTSEFGCRSSDFTWNHVVVVVALGISIVAGVIAWGEWTASDASDEAEGGDQMSRRRFMSLLGVLTSALFSITILAQWLPTLMGVPCDK